MNTDLYVPQSFLTPSLAETSGSPEMTPDSDLVILRQLRKSAESATFLARQKSLNRRVVVKIFRSGHEVLLPKLIQHEHIAPTFSEYWDEKRGVRFICRHYIVGVSFSEIFQKHQALGLCPLRTGADLLSAVDALTPERPVFHPLFAEQRLRFSRLNFSEVLATLGLQIAQTLLAVGREPFGHGALHGGNVFLTPYGRCLLTDFCWGREGSPLDDKVALHHLLQCLARIGEKKLDNRMPRPRSLQRLVSHLTSELALCEIKSKLPGPNKLVKFTARHPYLGFLPLRQVPHLLASFFCAAYCFLRRGLPLDEVAKQKLAVVAKTYHALSFTLGLALVVWLLAPLYAEKKSRRASARIARKKALRLPGQFAAINSFFWLGTLFVFPTATFLIAGEIHPQGTLHFAIAVGLAWMIATSYATLLTLFVAVEGIYLPNLLETTEIKIWCRVKSELGAVLPWVKFLPLPLAFIPLFAALLLVFLGPSSLPADRFYAFQALLLALLTFGVGGFVLSLNALQRLRIILSTLLRNNLK